MKYHVAIDLSEKRLVQLRIVAVTFGIPIRRLVAQIIEEFLISSKVAQEIKNKLKLEED